MKYLKHLCSKRRKNLERYVLLAFAVCFIGALSACGDESSLEGELPESTVSSAEEQLAENPLAIYEGWWHRPDNYISEVVSMVDIFQVNADSGTWTVYNEYGFAGETLSCYGDESSLTLDLSALGEATLFFDGTNFTDESGNIEFVRGEALDAKIAQDTISGVWYEGGTTEGSASIYLFDDSSYKHQLSGEVLLSTGSFEMGSYLDSQLPYVALTEPDSMFGYADYMLVDGKLLYDAFKAEFYVHESVLETPQGEQYTNMGRLICGTWKEVKEYDGKPEVMIDFGDVPEGDFAYITWVGENGSYVSENSEVGKWQVTQDGKITLTFADGTTEDVDFSGDTFTVEHYNTTFQDDSNF